MKTWGKLLLADNSKHFFITSVCLPMCKVTNVQFLDLTWHVILLCNYRDASQKDKSINKFFYSVATSKQTNIVHEQLKRILLFYLLSEDDYEENWGPASTSLRPQCKQYSSSLKSFNQVRISQVMSSHPSFSIHFWC